MTRLQPGPRGAGRLDGQRMEPTEHGASKARQQQEMIDQTHRDQKKERERGGKRAGRVMICKKTHPQNPFPHSTSLFQDDDNKVKKNESNDHVQVLGLGLGCFRWGGRGRGQPGPYLHAPVCSTLHALHPISVNKTIRFDPPHRLERVHPECSGSKAVARSCSAQACQSVHKARACLA